MVSETKYRRQFSIGNFLIHDFSLPYRLDRDSKGGGIMFYIREDIPAKSSCSRLKTWRKFLCRTKPME